MGKRLAAGSIVMGLAAISVCMSLPKENSDRIIVQDAPAPTAEPLNVDEPAIAEISIGSQIRFAPPQLRYEIRQVSHGIFNGFFGRRYMLLPVPMNHRIRKF